MRMVDRPVDAGICVLLGLLLYAVSTFGALKENVPGTGRRAAVSLLLVPLLFRPVVFPLFKLYGSSAAIATALAVTGFAATPIHAYAISAITGVLRSGGDAQD